MTQLKYLQLGVNLTEYLLTTTDNFIGIKQKNNIIDAANMLNMPSIKCAIAGAMAEENDRMDEFNAKATDFISKYKIPLTDLTIAVIQSFDYSSLSLNWGNLFTLLDAKKADYSLLTHQDWMDDYNDVVANPIDLTQINTVEKFIAKFSHPTLNDFGLANFNMATAIRLVKDNPESFFLSSLGNDYSQLAIALSSDNQGITAKLYGLMIKEADAWFTSKNAYGSDWASLPQEIKDALYITYNAIRCAP